MTEVLPEISFRLQAFIRVAYGCLVLLTLAWAIPHWRRFFLSERWGGWAESRPSINLTHNPVVAPLMLLAWAGAATALVLGRWTVAASLLNLILCRYFFVAMRWNGVLRGMGAPGFMTYWLAAAVFLLEYTRHIAPNLQTLALLTVQLDFAFIIGSAGIYKLTAGYAADNGMDLGLVNPQWGYWWRCYRRMRPGHWVFRAMNHAAWSTEIVAALLMVLPFAGTRAAGGLLIVASFIFIVTQIRLAWLAEMVMLCGLLFVPPGHLVDRWVETVVGHVLLVRPADLVLLFGPADLAAPVAADVGRVLLFRPADLAAALEVFLVAYLVLLPLAHAGLFYNFYARKRLPEPLQGLLERYTNVFGIVIWRVFSADHLNFFVRIYEERDGERRLISRSGSWRALRYSHVAESIAVTTVFTTLKYYASNPRLFESRLLRYARTVPVAPGARLIFEYVSIQKIGGRFEDVPAVRYIVSPADWSITVQPLVDSFSVHAADRHSPLHEGAMPGSYAPAR